MKQALIIGDSGGIGAAHGAELAARGVQVTGVSRSRDGLDIASEASVAHILGTLAGDCDLVIIATGALEIGAHEPEKSIRKLTADAMLAQFMVNTVGPAMVLKHAMRLLPKDRRAVIATPSARVGSIGENNLGGWYSYRTAKAALNQIVHTSAIELARSHKYSICMALAVWGS